MDLTLIPEFKLRLWENIMNLNVKDAASCKYDMISLGEIMLRLDPGEGRIKTARSFRAWEGGGEYNVARGLRRCFGMRTAAVTALADNEVGRLVEDFMLEGGVDTSLIKWVPYDGIGRTVRNGLNFTERGFGIRGALGVSDRGNTAVSKLKPGDIDWEHIFGELGVRWFHTGGIFAALSETTAEVVIEAVKTAKKYGTIVSYDLNYRPSLWKDIGGKEKAQEVNKKIAKSPEHLNKVPGILLFFLQHQLDLGSYHIKGHIIHTAVDDHICQRTGGLYIQIMHGFYGG